MVSSFQATFLWIAHKCAANTLGLCTYPLTCLSYFVTTLQYFLISRLIYASNSYEEKLVYFFVIRTFWNSVFFMKLSNSNACWSGIQIVRSIHTSTCINLLSPHGASKHNFTSLKIDLILIQLRSFRRRIFMKMFYQYMSIVFNVPPTSSHLHSLQVENCDSNSGLVVDVDDNGKFRPERVKHIIKRY